MVEAIFEHEGNSGLLKVTCHFGQIVTVSCDKHTEESFRLGGTAINEVAMYEGVLNFRTSTVLPFISFKAFRTPLETFEGIAILSNESWNEADTHAYITEHYEIEMENKLPIWFASKNPIKDANHLFINLDVLDGGNNIIKRYRVSPFTAEYKILTW